MAELNEIFLVLILVGLIIWFYETSNNNLDYKSNKVVKVDKKEPFIANRAPLKRFKRKKKLKVFKDKPELEPRIVLGPSPKSECVEQSKPIDKFNKQFFDFRDNIHENTSIRLDPVTKINNLRAEENVFGENRCQNTNICTLGRKGEQVGSSMLSPGEKRCPPPPSKSDMNMLQGLDIADVSDYITRY